MKKLLVTLCAICTSATQAGVTLKLEHPRYPSQVRDEYSVNCEKECAIEIVAEESGKTKVSQEPLQGKIKELMNLHVQGFLPKEPGNLRKILYKVKATDGDKKFDLLVGYPMSYEGTEYTKFSQLISVLEDIKRTMRTGIQEKK